MKPVNVFRGLHYCEFRDVESPITLGSGIAFVNPQTNNMVLLKPNGEFWSAWELGYKWHKGNIPQDLDVYRNGGLW